MRTVVLSLRIATWGNGIFVYALDRAIGRCHSGQMDDVAHRGGYFHLIYVPYGSIFYQFQIFHLKQFGRKHHPNWQRKRKYFARLGSKVHQTNFFKEKQEKQKSAKNTQIVRKNFGKNRKTKITTFSLMVMNIFAN